MKKILFIEDNIDIRETTADLLMLADFEVETAENGIVGVEKAKSFMPDIIICDIMMPELDGYGVLNILSKKPETASIPFIFLTAKSDKGDLRKGMNLGADDYLTKPFEESELLDAIDVRLRKKEMLAKEFSKSIDDVNVFFEELSEFDDLKDLSTDRPVHSFDKKSNIYREDTEAYGMYFIESGKVKTYKLSESGKEFVTGFFGPGDFIGYQALLSENGTYTETATVLETAEICKIPKSDFTKLIYSNRKASSSFINFITNNLKERETQLMEMAFNSVRHRVAKLLLELHQKESANATENPEISISRDDLAGYIGAAKETAIRTLSEFKEDNIISIENKRITVIDIDGLSKTAQSPYL